MSSGTVSLTVISDSTSGTINMLISTDAFPSFVTGPFAA
jgi:hypothetical protein